MPQSPRGVSIQEHTRSASTGVFNTRIAPLIQTYQVLALSLSWRTWFWSLCRFRALNRKLWLLPRFYLSRRVLFPVLGQFGDDRKTRQKTGARTNRRGNEFNTPEAWRPLTGGQHAGVTARVVGLSLTEATALDRPPKVLRWSTCNAIRWQLIARQTSFDCSSLTLISSSGPQCRIPERGGDAIQDHDAGIAFPGL